MSPSLVFLHVGDKIPSYFIHTLFQTLLIHQDNPIRIYLLINKGNIPQLQKYISNFNLYQKEILSWLTFIPLELLKKDYDVYKRYIQLMSNYEKQNPELFQFRNQFWKVSTERFYYIYSFMIKYNIESVFHVENDIMLYSTIPTIFGMISNSTDRMWVVQDSKNRAIGSLIYFPTSSVLHQFLQFANSILNKSYVNDMSLLGLYPLKNKFPDTPQQHVGVFDGAAIGQYLGGTDLRNSKDPLSQQHPFINPTVGFVNETSQFKPDTYTYTTGYKDSLIGYPKKLKKYYCVNSLNIKYPIHNLHIHSKQPFTFSSIFDISYTDLLTYSNILDKCDTIICTQTDYSTSFNTATTHPTNIIDKVLVVQNVNSIQTDKLKACLKELDKKHITCFIWGNLLESFLTDVFPNLEFTFTIVTNASEKLFTKLESQINKTSSIYHLFTVEPLTRSFAKIRFIPCIRSISSEHDHIEFYKTMTNTYLFEKTDSYQLDEDASYQDITKCYFFHCKSFDSIWKAFYLGVIPLFIVSENQDSGNPTNKLVELYTQVLEKMRLPYLVTTSDYLDSSFLNKTLYIKMLHTTLQGKSIFCQDSFKLSKYLF